MVDFRPAFIYLMRETFEGRPEGQDYTWFVEGKDGLFNALADVTAQQASVKPNPEMASIAAHVFHIRFALAGANGWATGNAPEGTWESTWLVNEVNPEEWEALKNDVRREYTDLLELIKTNEKWDEPDAAVGALAQLPHMAFHLGAIHQLKRLR